MESWNNKVSDSHDLAGESFASKVARESRLFAEGMTGFVDASKQAFRVEQLPETLGYLGLSSGIGMAMGKFAPMPGLTGVLARAAGVGFGISFVSEIAKNGKAALSAVEDNWNSDINWKQNVSTIRNGLGKFAFDSVLMTGAGAASAKLFAMPKSSGLLDGDKVPILPARYQPVKKDFSGLELPTISPEFSKNIVVDPKDARLKHPDLTADSELFDFLKKQDAKTRSSVDRSTLMNFADIMNDKIKSWHPDGWDKLGVEGQKLKSVQLRKTIYGDDTWLKDSQGNTFELKSSSDTPNRKLLAWYGDSEKNTTLIAEPKDYSIEQVIFAPVGEGKENLLVTGYKDGASVMYLHDPDGKLIKEIPVPENGSLILAKPGKTESEIAMLFGNATTALRTVLVDTKTGAVQIGAVREEAFKSEDFKTEKLLVPYKDKDGADAEVPVYISHYKNMKLDGSNPALVAVYGGFDAGPMFLKYHESTAAWLEKGGVSVVPILPGDGGRGVRNHEFGMGENKENTYLATIAVTEKIQEMGLSSPAKTAIYGSSNGGLVSATVINMRPDLFGAAAFDGCLSSILELQRVNVSAGVDWLDELGDSSKSSQIAWMSKLDVLNNLSPAKQYPPTMIGVGTKDANVNMGNGISYASVRQSMNNGEALLRVGFDKGHLPDHLAWQYAFLWDRLTHSGSESAGQAAITVPVFEKSHSPLQH